jgi:hypothetical protein
MTKLISSWRYMLTGAIIIVLYIVYTQFFNNDLVNEPITTTEVLSSKANVTPKITKAKNSQPQYSTGITDEQQLADTSAPENPIVAIKAKLTKGLSSHKNLTHMEKLDYETALFTEIMVIQHDVIQQAEQQGDNVAEVSAILQNAFATMSELAKEKDWQGYLGEVEKLVEMNTNLLDTIMVSALNCELPPEIIKELMHLGANFPDGATSIAAKSSEYVEAMVELGLDIHQISSFGKNGIHGAISIGSVASFDYFIEQGVSIKPSPYGLDPLDSALQYAVISSGDTYFAKKLIELGAPIEVSHKEALMKLQTPENFDVYVKLMNDLPELLE